MWSQRLTAAVDESVKPRAKVSRRVVLGGLAGASAFAMFGIDMAAGAAPAFATTAPTTPAGVIQLGKSYLGQGLATMRPQTASPWSTYPDESWCAWYVSWLLRGLGYGYQTYVDGFLSLPIVSTPQVGDLSFIGT